MSLKDEVVKALVNLPKLPKHTCCMGDTSDGEISSRDFSRLLHSSSSSDFSSSSDYRTPSQKALYGEKERKLHYVDDALLAEDIEVTVKGVGKLQFPIKEETVKKIIAIETKMGGTQMIPAEKIDVDIEPRCIQPLLLRLSKEMNLWQPCNLVWRNMLVCGPGQSYKEDDDPQYKAPNVVATFTLVLPSPHKGGDLVIHRKQSKRKFFSSGNQGNVKCIAFRSDHDRKVLKVEKGYRVALTCDLRPDKMFFLNERLRKSVVNFFEKIDKPDKLIYLLDHKYSERGLKWRKLKNKDRIRALALLAVAKKEGYYPALTVAHTVVEFGEGKPVYSKFYFWIDESDSRTCQRIVISEEEICCNRQVKFYRKFKEESSFGCSHLFRRTGVALFRSVWNSPGCKKELMNLHKMAAEPNLKNDVLQKFHENARGFFLTDKWSNGMARKLLDIVRCVRNEEFTGEVLSKLYPKLVLDSVSSNSHALILSSLNVSTWQKIVDGWKSTRYSLSLKIMMPFLSKCISVDLYDHQVILNEAIELFLYECSYGASLKPAQIVTYCWVLTELCQLIDLKKINQAAAACLARAVQNFDDWKTLQDKLTPEQLAFASQNVSAEKIIYTLLRTMNEEVTRDFSGKKKWAVSQIISVLRDLGVVDNPEIQGKIIEHFAAFSSLYTAEFLDDLVTGLHEAFNMDQMKKYVTLTVEIINTKLGQEQKTAHWCLPVAAPCSCDECKIVNRFLASPYDDKRSFHACEGYLYHICKSLRFVDPTLLQICKRKLFRLTLTKLRKVEVCQENFNKQLLLFKSVLLKAAPAELKEDDCDEPSAKLPKTCP